MNTTLISRRLILGSVLLILGACASDSKEIVVVPDALAPLNATAQINRVWTYRVGGGSDGLVPGLAPVGNGPRVFVAAADGAVHAVDARNGQRQWMTPLNGDVISGGPAFGGDMVVVGTSEGEVIALSADDGTLRWRQRVSSSVLAAPAVNSRVVVVRTVDGILTALDASDGEALWQVDRRVQGLTLHGHATPVLVEDAVLSGFDNGKIAAVEAATGIVRWERSVSERRGRNEFERLADVDSIITVSGEDIFTVGFQGRAMLIAAPTGRPVWAQDMSSHHPIALDWNQLFVAAENDDVIALDRRNGVQLWKQDQLSNREVTAPALVGDSVVVGDFEGYLHWMSALDGSFQARSRAGSDALKSDPLVLGDMLYVQSENGSLYAFTKQARKLNPPPAAEPQEKPATTTDPEPQS